MIGAYGPWAASLAGDGPARLSLRNDRFGDLDAWRREATARARACVLEPVSGDAPKAELQHRLVYDGLHVEHLTWQLPYGPPTEAFFLKPEGATGRLPAVLGLHDHGGNKYFGARKIAQVSDDLHPVMRRHRDRYYGGVSWANDLARRGYAVLVHDAFAFGSRRVRAGDLPERLKDRLGANYKEARPESEAEIDAYNQLAAQHEDVMSKSLFCAGTTWPGVVLAEDRRALDVLCAAPMSTRRASAAPGCRAEACAPSTSAGWTTASPAPAAWA